MNKPKLSIVIPCYNEGRDIKNNAQKVLEYMSKFDFGYELILVDDGSKDNTLEVISNIKGVLPIGYKPNRGKGGAVKEGILNATGEFVLFMDADLSTDLSAIDALIPLLKEDSVVLGTRHHKDSVIPIKQPLTRQIVSKGCRVVVNNKFKFNVTDTQCGFKAFPTDFAKKMVQKQVTFGFAFDVEYLYIAKLNGLKLVELPIVWRDDRGSTVDVFKTTKQFFKDMKIIKKNKKNYIF